MNDEFFQQVFQRTVIKKWSSSQTSILTDAGGLRYVEKEDALLNGVDELEIYTALLNPLKIDHTAVIASERTARGSRFVQAFIDGITCSEAPTAQHLYDAATKAGAIYRCSIENMHRISPDILHKYLLTEEKMLAYVEAFPPELDGSIFVNFIHHIYEKYKGYPLFLNHFDLHFQNLIATDKDLVIIDWAASQLCPFYADLYVLLCQADEVLADAHIIVENYRKAAGISSITRKEILEGTICWCLPTIYQLLALQCTSDIPFYQWAMDQYEVAVKALREL